jgi:CRP/FNR family transcriptional regulator, cyclic AMP receptor protein
VVCSGRLSVSERLRPGDHWVVPFTELVRILDADPDLATGLTPRERELARRHLVGRVITLGRKRDVSATFEALCADDPFGLLILDGLIVRRVEMVGERSVELLAAGDVIRPCQADGDLASLPATATWITYEPARIAVLDREATSVLGRFPSVLSELAGRLVQRSNTLAINLVIAQLPRLEERLLALLWHLGDRFGRVEPGGVIVPLRLSHGTLAELVHARRPSVTTALSRLADRGLIARHADGRISLRGDPRSAIDAERSRDHRFVLQPVGVASAD